MVDKGILDDLTRRHTAFASFEALCNAPGNYFPSLRTRTASGARQKQELYRLAGWYDERQAQFGDKRRAHRC